MWNIAKIKNITLILSWKQSFKHQMCLQGFRLKQINKQARKNKYINKCFQ